MRVFTTVFIAISVVGCEKKTPHAIEASRARTDSIIDSSTNEPSGTPITDAVGEQLIDWEVATNANGDAFLRIRRIEPGEMYIRSVLRGQWEGRITGRAQAPLEAVFSFSSEEGSQQKKIVVGLKGSYKYLSAVGEISDRRGENGATWREITAQFKPHPSAHPSTPKFFLSPRSLTLWVNEDGRVCGETNLGERIELSERGRAKGSAMDVADDMLQRSRADLEFNIKAGLRLKTEDETSSAIVLLPAKIALPSSENFAEVPIKIASLNSGRGVENKIYTRIYTGFDFATRHWCSNPDYIQSSARIQMLSLLAFRDKPLSDRMLLDLSPSKKELDSITRLFDGTNFDWGYRSPFDTLSQRDQRGTSLSKCLSDGTVIAEWASGESIKEINITLTSRDNSPILVRIDAGTTFVSRDQSVQNMISVTPRLVTVPLVDHIGDSVSLEVACLEMNDEIPKNQPYRLGAIATLNLSDSAKLDLVKLVRSVTFHTGEWWPKQLAVWTLTDNPPPGGYKHLVYSNSPTAFFQGGGVSRKELLQAKVLLDDAGINVRKYKAFARD